MNGDEELEKYGWFTYNKNDVFENKDNVWLRCIMVSQYKHKGTKGVKYKETFDDVLRNQVKNRIAEKVIKNVGFITFNNHFTLNMNPFIYLCNKS